MGQADNEIQVYASAITPKKVTLLELHQNYTFNGMKGLPDPKQARWLEETVEITRGLGGNFELGFYTFTGISPNGHFQYLGNHIRPRYTFPASDHFKFGTSISLELGFIRPDAASSFQMDGELRPIIDRTFGNYYFSFNPNVAFVLTGDNKAFKFGPQFKACMWCPINSGWGLNIIPTWAASVTLILLSNRNICWGLCSICTATPTGNCKQACYSGLPPAAINRYLNLLPADDLKNSFRHHNNIR